MAFAMGYRKRYSISAIDCWSNDCYTVINGINRRKTFMGLEQSISFTMWNTNNWCNMCSIDVITCTNNEDS